MRTAPFGPARLDVPVVGQGTWNLELDDERTAVAALQAGIDAGMTHIDTAEMYGGGRAERIVAKAIEGRRDDVFLVSKVLPSHATYDGTLRACERTLQRLGTDRLDVYLLHWPGSVPLAETLRAFEALRTDGKILSYGVSNFDVDELAAAVAIAGPQRIACNQVLYHLGERSIEHALVPACRRHGVAAVAYSPFGSGRFPPRRSGGAKLLADLGAARGASPHQMALAFLIQQGGVFAIPKAAEPSHALENAAAGDIVLTAAEMQAIDAAFASKPRRGLAML